MSKYDYDLSIQISARDEPFYALLFALMRCADDANTEKLKRMWPDKWKEVNQRSMSRFDYEASKEILEYGEPFCALLFALMRRADDINTAKFKRIYPEEWEELYQRYHAPGGFLEGETDV